MQNFPRMAEEDGNLAMKEWAADLPGSEDERDRAAGEDENPDADAQAGGGQGESASTHPSADLPDDDEVMILEPLRVTPLASVPPAAGSARRSGCGRGPPSSWKPKQRSASGSSRRSFRRRPGDFFFFYV